MDIEIKLIGLHPNMRLTHAMIRPNSVFYQFCKMSWIFFLTLDYKLFSFWRRFFLMFLIIFISASISVIFLGFVSIKSNCRLSCIFFDQTDYPKPTKKSLIPIVAMISSWIFKGLFQSCRRYCFTPVGGAVASWLVRSSPDRAVWVQTLARDIVLCPWARHFTLTVPLSTQVYKWVSAKLMLEVIPMMDYHPIQGRVEILLFASCYRSRRWAPVWWAT